MILRWAHARRLRTRTLFTSAHNVQSQIGPNLSQDRFYCLDPVTSRRPRSVPIGEREVGRIPRVRTEAST
jgi:hypothetical protein